MYCCAVRLGEAKQIEWSQVDLDAALIRLEQDQTKNGLARIIPIPDVVVEMLRNVPAKARKGPIFYTTNLRKEWQKACVATGLGTFTEVLLQRENVVLTATRLCHPLVKARQLVLGARRNCRCAGLGVSSWRRGLGLRGGRRAVL